MSILSHYLQCSFKCLWNSIVVDANLLFLLEINISILIFVYFSTIYAVVKAGCYLLD